MAEEDLFKKLQGKGTGRHQTDIARNQPRANFLKIGKKAKSNFLLLAGPNAMETPTSGMMSYLAICMSISLD